MPALKKRFKLSLIALLLAAFVIFGFDASRVSAFSGGPPNGHTGAPGELTCATSGCHLSFPVNSGSGALTLTGLPANYSPNQEIELTVTLNQADRALYGFQLTAIDDAGKKAGELIITNSTRTQKSSATINDNLREYISHTFDGTSPNGANRNGWTFKWKAPAQSAGQVTFYVAGNAANGNGTPEGDFIYTINARTQLGSVAPMANVSAASFAANAAMVGEMIAAAFGANLSTGTVAATTLPLPTELGGAQLRVRDAAGNDRLAQLFFVSPTQINYLVPAGTSAGLATVTVSRSSNDIAQGAMSIEPVAPGLFSANANGQGVAAAVVLRRRGGVDTFEPVAQFNSTTSRFEPIPIDLGQETDTVVLVAFGTGFRAAAQSAVSATIGGTASAFVATAPAPGFVGLDQANILIPRSLISRGLVDIVFTAAGKTANTVQINVR